MKHKTPYTRALSSAKKELSRANERLRLAQAQVTECHKTIPDLQRTIAALEHQLNPKASGNDASYKPNDTVLVAAAETLGMPDPRQYASPEVMVEQDLLPEPDGSPILE